MNILVNDVIKQFNYMGKFKCIADKCPDHCCYGWNVSVDRKTQELYEKEAPELLQAVVSKDSGHYIKQAGKDHACIMMKDGLCGVQCKYGSKYMGDTCLLYPRIRNKIGETVMLSASLSCPEIVRLCLYGKDPFGIQKGQLDRLSINSEIIIEDGDSEKSMLKTSQNVIKFCDDENIISEELVLKLIDIANQLEELPRKEWGKTVILLLQNSVNNCASEYYEEYLYKFLEMIVALNSPKKINRKRFYLVLENIVKVLQIELDFENSKIKFGKNSHKIYRSLLQKWHISKNLEIQRILRRYIQAHLAMQLFPYGKPYSKLSEQAIIFAIKFILVKLGLITYMQSEGESLSQETIIMIIQSISRWLDHASLTALLPKCEYFGFYDKSILENMILGRV